MIKKKVIRALDAKTFEDYGNIEIIESVDRCKTCCWFCLDHWEIPNGFGGKEVFNIGYECGIDGRKVEPDDYCAWWEEE